MFSFAMTCCEVITSCVPFESHDVLDYDTVLHGERPTLPNDPAYSHFNDLVTKCWHRDPRQRPSYPRQRPSYTEIIKELKYLSFLDDVEPMTTALHSRATTKEFGRKGVSLLCFLHINSTFFVFHNLFDTLTREFLIYSCSVLRHSIEYF